MLRELLRVLELSLRELRASERELLAEEQEEAAPTAASAGAGVGASSPQAAAHTPRRRAGETMRPRGGGVAGETPARGRRKREAAHAARPADDTAAGRQLRRSEELHREAVARRARHEQAQEAFALSLAHILGGAGAGGGSIMLGGVRTSRRAGTGFVRKGEVARPGKNPVRSKGPPGGELLKSVRV